MFKRLRQASSTDHKQPTILLECEKNDGAKFVPAMEATSVVVQSVT
jgi:hypothetical protein